MDVCTYDISPRKVLPENYSPEKYFPGKVVPPKSTPEKYFPRKVTEKKRQDLEASLVANSEGFRTNNIPGQIVNAFDL